MNDQELKHWGVLGMKWGRRKAKGNSNAAPSKGHAGQSKPTVDTRSADAIKYDSIKHKQLNELTNEELRWLTNRIQLERGYTSAVQAERKEKINNIKNTLGTAASIASSVWTIVNMYDNFAGRARKDVSVSAPKKDKKKINTSQNTKK